MSEGTSESIPPLRVLHLTTASHVGGLSRYLFDLCRAMHDQGHQVAIAGRRGKWHELFDQAPWPWVDVPSTRRPWGTARMVLRLRRYVRAHQIDVLHAHYRSSAIAGRWLARLTGRPLVFTLHVTNIPMGLGYRLLTEWGDWTHAPSAQAGRWLQSVAHRPPHRIVVIPHGVDVARYPLATDTQQKEARRQLGLRSEATVAVIVGRPTPQKNVGWVLDLAQAARGQVGNIQFLILGDDPPEMPWRSIVARRGLDDMVVVQPYGAALGAYQAADALLLPSQYEGFALSAAEAMSVGRPVLRTRTAGCEEQVIEGVTGRSVPVDHDAFVTAGLDFLADREALRHMGSAAAIHVRAHLRHDQQVERTVDFYRRVLDAHNHRSSILAPAHAPGSNGMNDV